MWNITYKELRNLLYSPKFLTLAAASFILIFIGILNGYVQYRLETDAAVLAEQIEENDLKSAEGYWALSRGVTVIRHPQKLAIFDIGITGAIGRKSEVGEWNQARSRDSRYGQDPILAVFGELDLPFIVGLVLSLFAILFSYNAVSGEREAGTLQLMMSNPVRRTSVIIAKLLGGYVPLALIFLLPFLLGLAGMMILTDIAFSSEEWLRIAIMVLAVLIYLLAFYAIGLAVSALTRNSFVSFIVALLIWVASVAIIPKAAIHVAAITNPSMTSEELNESLRAIWVTEINVYGRKFKKYFDEHPTTEKEYREKAGEIREKIVSERREERESIQLKLYGEYDRRRKGMVDTAAAYARISPTSAFSFAIHNLTNTGPYLLDNFEHNLSQYRNVFKTFAEAKINEQERQEQRRESRLFYKVGEDGYIQAIFNEDYQPPELDLTGMPRFSDPLPDLVETSGDFVSFIGILAFYAVAFFAVAYVAFLRYDVR